VNCVTVGIGCAFQNTIPSRLSLGRLVSGHLVEQNKIDGSPASVAHESYTPRPQPLFDPNVNLEHLELFHHWMTETHLTFIDEDRQQEKWRASIIREGLIHPFLMHQVLAVSAVHLANTTSSRRTHYYHLATELQSSAMAGFSTLQGRVDKSSCAAVFLFSSLIALHVLADHSRIEDLDNNGLIDHFLHCIRLMQGVSTLVLDKWWPTIKGRPDHSPLAYDCPLQEQPKEVPEQVRQLRGLLCNSGLGQQALAAYSQAIDSLEWVYAVSGVPHRTYGGVRWIIAWPVRSPPEYLELVAERRPEALIILAYYVALLHFHQQSWVVGEIAPLLINAINDNLGVYWRHWMLWPNNIIGFVKCSDDKSGIKESRIKAVVHPSLLSDDKTVVGPIGRGSPNDSKQSS